MALRRIIPKLIIMGYPTPRSIEFGGYLTPSDFFTILEHEAVRPTASWKEVYMENKRASGISNPTWVYFISENPDLNHKLRERHAQRLHQHP